MQFSPQQEQAVLKIRNWLLDEGRAPFLYLAGYAGTGKTTLATVMPEIVGGADRVMYAAFTGKAALQLSRKGCVGATTLHRILYSPADKDRTKLNELMQSLVKVKEDTPFNHDDIERLSYLIKEERKKVKSPSWVRREEKLPSSIKCLVIDECSMLSPQLLGDAIALEVPILLLGDPFQLPPVAAKSPLDDHKPDIMLTEVHRQALDSAILRSATNLRNGEWIETGSEQEDFRVVHRNDTSYETYAWADQILCARNKTRQSFNSRIRVKLIEAGSIEAGTKIAKNDRVVFLKNDHDEGIFNGTTATVDDAQFYDEVEHSIYLDFTTDDAKKLAAYQTWCGIIDGLESIDMPRGAGQSVDYAYALTVHKAQGSEWDKVLVYNEGIFGDDYKRWLYTAITRARFKCLVVNT